MTLITGYHEIAFSHEARGKAVERLAGALLEYPQNVGIVCTGLSGILVGVALADHTKREFAIVRKPNEETHSSYSVEGYILDEYVIVDDFMDGGETVKRILEKMSDRTLQSVCRGILLYNDHFTSGPVEHNSNLIRVTAFQ